MTQKCECVSFDKSHNNLIYNKMKKVLLLALFAIFTVSGVMAQETTEKPEKLRWQGHITNKFWDNWEVGVGGGASFLDLATKPSAKEPGGFFQRLGWNANISATKWFAPIVGVRLQLDGGKFQNYSYNKPEYGDGCFNTPYVFLHGDLMVNLSNWIGGYREDRVYYAVPYAGFGFYSTSFTKKSVGSRNNEYAATFGLLNKFRVCEQIDINLDLRTWLSRQADLPVEFSKSGAYAFSFVASVGVSYRFNKRNWDVAHTQAEVDGYVAAIADLDNRLGDANNKLSDANNKINDLNNENDRLKDDLANCLKAKEEAEKQIVTPETVVFFSIDKSNISAYSKATLDNYIATVKDAETKLVVTGYADKETGSAAVNDRISKARAEAVRDYLVEKGIAEDRIEVKWVGDTEQAFAKPHGAKINRCVVIR